MSFFTSRSISNKLLLVIMATTFVALFACVGALLVYDLRTYRYETVRDLTTQAKIIAEVSTPALEFNDPKSAAENLDVLRTRPFILGATIVASNGHKFAHYEVEGGAGTVWDGIEHYSQGYRIDGDRIYVWQPIVKNNERFGTVYITANYGSHKRLVSYTLILGCVMLACLGLATLVAIWLGRAVTKPIFAVTSVAVAVMQTRDFSLRAQKYTEDEIGVLSDAFNDMLIEVERQTGALEQSNQSLAHEMSERVAAEGALRAADVQKDEFLATLAHELRNPLASLSNSLEVLRLVKGRPDLEENSQKVMDRQLQQMVRLVNDLLDVSRINTGKLTIVKKQLDLQSVIKDAVESSCSLINFYKHTLIVDLPEHPVLINADPIRLAQVFSNILINAAKYTDASGRITISHTLENDAICVSISDTGIGIAPNMLKNIFAMFAQVDQSLERAQAGLGVGLALAKHLTELHGYELEVSSDGIGKGSTFTVRINLTQALAPAVEEKTEFALSSSSKRVMLVDDNVDYATSMGTLLESLGHTVQVAHDGFSALDIAKEYLPEIAFLDIGMPGMSGYVLAKHLREMPETKHIVLVAITGWGQEKDKAQSREAGFNHHLVKPVSVVQLSTLIKQEFE